jgi:hypothetical protein
VLDQLRGAGLDPVGVSTTGGRATTFDGHLWRVPKRELVRALVAAVENGRLKVAAGLRFADAFKAKLRAFERRFTARGNETLDGAGEHDDLVIAAALIAWWAGRAPRLPAGRPLSRKV